MASGPKLTLFELRVIELKAELEKRNIDNMGVKAVLVKRLKDAMIDEGLDPETYVFNLGGKTSPTKKLTRSESKPEMESPKDSSKKEIRESSSSKTDDDKSTSSEEKRKDSRTGGSRKSLRQKSSSKEDTSKSEDSNTDKTVSSGSEGNLSIHETNSAEKVSLGKGKKPEVVIKVEEKEQEPEEESVEDNVFCSEEKADETSEKIVGEELEENEECPEELPEEYPPPPPEELKEFSDDKIDVSSDEEADLGSEAMNIKDIPKVESPILGQNGAGQISPDRISVEEKPLTKEDNGTEDENGSEERSTNKMSEEADDEKEATNEETTDIESDKSPVKSESSKASSRKRKKISREASKDDFSTDGDADNAQIVSTHVDNVSADGDADNTEKDDVNGPSYDKITESAECVDEVKVIDLDFDDMEDMEADVLDEIEPSGDSPGRELSTEEIVDEVMNVEDKSEDALVADDTADEALEPMDYDVSQPAEEEKESVPEKSPVKEISVKPVIAISEPIVTVNKTMALDEEIQQMDFDFDTLEDSECDDKPDQGREIDNQEASLDSVEQDGIDPIEDSINLNIAEEDTKIIEEAASLENKDATGERKQADQGKKTVDSRKGDKPHSSPSKTKTENDGKHRNLWVCNLSHTTRATDLKYIFSKHGKVVAAKIVTNARTPGARCYGYITMATPEDAAACSKALNVTELHGKLISIEVVASKPTSTKKNEDQNKAAERKPITHEIKPIEPPSPDPKKKKDDEIPPSKRDSISSDKKHRESRDERRRTELSGSERSSRTISRDRRSPVHGALSFEHIREQRDRQRLYEQHRHFRKMEKRRTEERKRQREVEIRQKVEALRLEREREKLALEREKIDRQRAELLRLERDRLERAKEALRRQQLKLEEAKRSKRSAPIDDYDTVPWKRQAVESNRSHYHRSPSPRSLDRIYKHDSDRGREADRSRLARDSRRREDIPRSTKDRLMDRDRGTISRRDDRRDDHHSSKDKLVPVAHHFRYKPSSSKAGSSNDSYRKVPVSSSSDSYRKVAAGSSSDSYRKTSPGYSSTKVSYVGNSSSGSGSKVSGYRDTSGNWVPTKSLPPWRTSSSSASERWPPESGYNVSMVPSLGMNMPPASAYTSTSDRFDAYKTLPNASRKF